MIEGKAVDMVQRQLQEGWCPYCFERWEAISTPGWACMRFTPGDLFQERCTKQDMAYCNATMARTRIEG